MFPMTMVLIAGSKVNERTGSVEEAISFKHLNNHSNGKVSDISRRNMRYPGTPYVNKQDLLFRENIVVEKVKSFQLRSSH